MVPGRGALVAMAAMALLMWRGGCEPPAALGPAGEGLPSHPAGRLSAEVVRVTDGDTIAVSLGDREEEVRLIGVDTPETVDPDEPVQCFGPEASAFAHELLDRQRVGLELGAERRDAYGRLLAYVYIDGRLVNAMLARRGLARPLSIAPNDAKAALFERLALAAARSKRGLWNECPA